MFKNLKIYYMFVALPFAVLLTLAAIFHYAVQVTITNNPHPQIVYIIFLVIIAGASLILLNCFRLVREAKVLLDFRAAVQQRIEPLALQQKANSYSSDIACLLQMVSASSGRSISHQEQAAIENELANTRARLNRRNSLPQYLTGLLVGMGLLGTFIGLLATLHDIQVLISSFSELDMHSVDPILVFRTMIERMKAPMQSMGIAFSSSMYGLLGSIILGLMMVGIRRLQGDIFSLLSSDVARHIENALAYDGGTAGNRAASTGDEYKVLVRIEERLAEGARLQQRMLTLVAEDFQKQRADMVRTLAEQSQSNNGLHSELQQQGRLLGDIASAVGKGNMEISTQFSELAVQLAGDARESHKLLAQQVDEQKRLREGIDAYKIEERLSEAARLQQRMLAAEIEDFQKQRADMLRTLGEQTEASNSFRGELQHLGRHLGDLFGTLEKGNNEVYSQLANLTVHLVGEARESQKLLAMQMDEQKKLREAIDSYKIQETLEEAARLQERMLTAVIQDFQGQRSEILRTLAEQIEASNGFRHELQQLGRQFGEISHVLETGGSEIYNQISELTVHMVGDGKESNRLLTRQVDAQKLLIDTLDSYHIGERLAEATRLRQRALAAELEDFQKQRADLLRVLTEQAEASHHFRTELQQLGGQLATVCDSMERGNDDIRSQISELMVHMAADAKESHKLLAMQVNEQQRLRDSLDLRVRSNVSSLFVDTGS